MTRKIRYTAPAAGEEPAIQVKFKGPSLMTYFSLRRIASKDFEMPQTSLCRLILVEWVKRYIAAHNGEHQATIRQMVLALGLDMDSFKKGAAQEGKAK